MLSRFRAAKKEELEAEKGIPTRRPYVASECSSVKECEKWRADILRVAAKKIAQIQNAGLGEHRIRELNDQINRLFREKWHWDERILQLGGPNYHLQGPKVLDSDGKEIKGSHGYKYYGAAKSLPGVRELFEAQQPAASDRNKGNIIARIDAEYYGYRDEEDGVLLVQEAEAERQAVARTQAEWEERKKNGTLPEPEPECAQDENGTPMEVDEDAAVATTRSFKSLVVVPTQEEIEMLLLEKKKRILMQQYASEALQSEAEHTRQLTGRA